MKDVELQEQLGHLTSAVGHHVINSFSTIVSQGEIVRMLLDSGQVQGSADFRERIDTIIRTSLEASVMTRRLIELSHELTSIDAPGPSQPEEVLLDRLVAEFVQARKDEGPAGIDWVADLSPVRPFRGRPGALRTMLALLAQNAVEALKEGRGTIGFSISTAPRDWLVLEVRDDGCGMPPEVLEHATVPFFTTKPDRLGVGLTVARGIWRRHRGTLAIESQPGAGTTIRLSIATAGGS